MDPIPSKPISARVLSQVLLENQTVFLLVSSDPIQFLHLHHSMASLPSPSFLPMAAAANPRKPASSPSGSDPKRRPWWAPLFRSVIRDGSGSGNEAGPRADPVAGGDPSAAARRRAMLTAEKARVLRRETRATVMWHDAMYHSAIATRLASPDDDEP